MIKFLVSQKGTLWQTIECSAQRFQTLWDGYIANGYQCKHIPKGVRL